MSLLATTAHADAHSSDMPAGEHASNVEDRRSILGDWVPALALSGSFFGQGHESSVESSCDEGGPGAGVLATCTQGQNVPGTDPRFLPPANGGPGLLRPDHDATDFPLWPAVGVELQLSSPGLVEVPYTGGRARVFVGAEVTAAFPPTRTIATEGNLDVLREPGSGQPSTVFPSQSIEGAGSQTQSVPQTFQYSAQIGVTFPIKFRGRTINIKPSFGWSQWKLDIKGRVLAAIKDDVNGTPGSPVAPFGAFTREIELQSTETLTVDGIGPGIEVEYVSGYFNDIGAAVFFGVNAYKVLGDRNVELRDSETFPGGVGGGVNPDDLLLEDTYRARWTHEIDPWFYRIRLGIRLHYDPR